MPLKSLVCVTLREIESVGYFSARSQHLAQLHARGEGGSSYCRLCASQGCGGSRVCVREHFLEPKEQTLHLLETWGC